MAPEMRLYHREPNKGAVVLVDDQMGKTWGCSLKKLPINAVASIAIPGQDIQDTPLYDTVVMPIRMRVTGPANKREIQAALQRVNARVTLARGHWYEVHAD